MPEKSLIASPVVEKLLKRIGNDKDLYNSLLLELKTSFDGFCFSFKEKLENKDLKACFLLSHDLKNSLQSFFEGSIIDKIYELEKASRSGDIKKVKAILADFEEIAKEVDLSVLDL